jgi:gluconolactonase
VFVAHDPRFDDLLAGSGPAGPAGVHLVAAVAAHEGPVYLAAEDALYVTSLPVSRPGAGPDVAIWRLQLDGARWPINGEARPDHAVTVVRGPAGAANGMALDTDGALLVCEQGGPNEPAAITRVDPVTGARTVLVDRWQGRPLSSPNDVIVAVDGAVWFTDPSYGHLQGFRPAPELPDAVYRLDRATGRLDVVSQREDKPNGLVLSPDERTLYVADSGAIHAPDDYDPGRPHHVVGYDVGYLDHAGGGRRVTLGGRRLVAEVPGFPDGLAVSPSGLLFVCCATGILVVDPHPTAGGTGTLLGEVRLPGAVNLAFGGPGGCVGYVTTDDAVRAVVLPGLAH